MEGLEALTFVRFHRGLPDVCLSASDDDPGGDMDAVCEAIRPHFQLSLVCTIWLMDLGEQRFEPRDDLLQHPVIARAYRFELHAFGSGTEEATLPDESVARAIDAFRHRKLSYVLFGRTTPDAKDRIWAELTSHVLTGV